MMIEEGTNGLDSACHQQSTDYGQWTTHHRPLAVNLQLVTRNPSTAVAYAGQARNP